MRSTGNGARAGHRRKSRQLCAVGPWDEGYVVQKKRRITYEEFRMYALDTGIALMMFLVIAILFGIALKVWTWVL